MNSDGISALHHIAPTREDYIKDVARFKLGLADSTASGSRSLNTIVDCLMQGAFEEFERVLHMTITPLTKERCRQVVGGKLFDKLANAYIEKAYPVFAKTLLSFSAEELKLIIETFQEGRSGKTIMTMPDFENYDRSRSIKTVIYDTPVHEKFDIAISTSATAKDLKPIQDEIIGMGPILLSQDVLEEMHAMVSESASPAISSPATPSETTDQPEPLSGPASAAAASAAAASAPSKASEQVD